MNKVMMQNLMSQIRTYGQMIKFSHTIFALPFALSAVAMAWEHHSPSVWHFFWIVVAMVGARSAAMGFNRIVDAKIDAKNERTAIREIPSGKLSQGQSMIFVAGASALFIFSAAMLSKLCLILSVPVLILLLFYSYTKRFTRFCHIYLGFAISLAPAGAWVAIAGNISWSVVFLSLALMSYIAGFDILYACQDIDFDKEEGLYSIPAKMGPDKAMKISLALHLLFIIFLCIMCITFSMHPVFWLFILLIAGLLVIEHRLVRPDDLSNINIAFFHMNSIISVVLFVGVLIQGVLE